jgi:multisubunit Na+/H+ antiporter MnhE subunit
MHTRICWPGAAEVLWWWGACVGIWLLTLSSVTPAELTVAIACGLPCALAARAARRAAGDAWLPRARWLAWLVLLPAAVLADTARLTGLLAQAARGRADPGRLRDIRLPAAEPGPVALAHRALASLAISASPGTLVVDSDPRGSKLTIHAMAGGWPGLDRAAAR